MENDAASPTNDSFGALAARLKKKNIEFVATSADAIMLTPHPKVNARPGVTTQFPLSLVTKLDEQLSDDMAAHPELIGIFSRELGFVEVVLFESGRFMGPLERALARLAPIEQANCPHATGSEQLPSYPLSVRTSYSNDERTDLFIHLADPEIDACIEISGPSPCAIAWGIFTTPYGSSEDNLRLRPTIKIFFDKAFSTGELIARSGRLINSTLYELDIRNGIKSRPRHWDAQRRIERLSATNRPSRAVQFPRTKVPTEVAELFSFASEGAGDPPLAYLFYYQVLEHFFPIAVRRDGLRRIEKELTDPQFSRTDSRSLMRILHIAEKAANQPEVRQLETLARESVRSEKLLNYFEEDGCVDHFSKNGPILGVEPINPKNTSIDIVTQVAIRIYQIRNRIVHSKDDPKYSNLPPLLPRGHEASRLRLDVGLVRLIATEAILHNSV